MLEISPSKVVHVIYLAREMGGGDAELHAFIDALNDDEKAQLTPSAWPSVSSRPTSSFGVSTSAPRSWLFSIYGQVIIWP